MMNEWEALGKHSIEEMKSWPVGTRVQLNFLTKPIGTIIEIQEPFGLLAPRYKCKWDDGDKSDFLLANDLIKLTGVE